MKRIYVALTAPAALPGVIRYRRRHRLPLDITTVLKRPTIDTSYMIDKSVLYG